MKKHTFINMVTRAIAIIQEEAANFVGTTKTGYDGVDDDLVTTADIKAQAFYQGELERLFPDEGIIGEEKLNKKSKNGAYFTIDPLDGTKAYGRRQSTGVGTMLAHVNAEGKVDMVAIGDVNTGEVYYFDEETSPLRIRFGLESPLVTEVHTPLEKTYVALREHPATYPVVLQSMFAPDGLFENISVDAGSIGVQMAKLWKGEVSANILLPNYDTPWDNTPLIGMTEALGLVRMLLDPETLEVTIGSAIPPKRIQYRTDYEIITRKEYVPAIFEWIRA